MSGSSFALEDIQCVLILQKQVQFHSNFRQKNDEYRGLGVTVTTGSGLTKGISMRALL